jgi:PAS domain S-box-containing protein
MSPEQNPAEKKQDLHSRLSWEPDFEDKGASCKFASSVYLDILDSLPFYVLLVDQNHRILLANRATRNALGMRPKEIIGEYCPRLVHGIEEGSYPGCPLEEAVETQEPVEREYYDKEEDRWLKIAMYPTTAWTVDGEKVYFHMIEDITRIKELEQAFKDAVKKEKDG